MNPWRKPTVAMSALFPDPRPEHSGVPAEASPPLWRVKRLTGGHGSRPWPDQAADWMRWHITPRVQGGRLPVMPRNPRMPAWVFNCLARACGLTETKRYF